MGTGGKGVHCVGLWNVPCEFPASCPSRPCRVIGGVTIRLSTELEHAQCQHAPWQQTCGDSAFRRTKASRRCDTPDKPVLSRAAALRRINSWEGVQGRPHPNERRRRRRRNGLRFSCTATLPMSWRRGRGYVIMRLALTDWLKIPERSARCYDAYLTERTVDCYLVACPQSRSHVASESVTLNCRREQSTCESWKFGLSHTQSGM